MLVKTSILLLVLAIQLVESGYVPVTAEILDLKFSHHGPLDSRHCIATNEPQDSGHGWDDNYLCTKNDYGEGVKWSHQGPIEGLKCTKVYENWDKNGWDNNYICIQKESKWEFVYSHHNAIDGLSCIRFSEIRDPHGWWDNYLCVKGEIWVE